MDHKNPFQSNPFFVEMLRKDEQRRRQAEEEEKQRRLELQKREEQYLAQRRLLHLREFSREEFMKAQDCFRFDYQGSITSQELYTLYCSWCQKQKVLPFPARAFLLHVSQNALQYNIRHTTNLRAPSGSRARGFHGIRALLPEEQHGLNA